MTEKEVRDKLLRWLAGVMGVTVIQSFQGGKPPAEPYGVLNLMVSGELHEHPSGNEYTSTGSGEAETFSQAPVQDWFFRFSLNVYGSEAKTILRKVRTASRVLTAMEGLQPLTLAETSPIRDVTEILNEEFQPRAQMDIEVYAVIRDSLPIHVIETSPFDFERS